MDSASGTPIAACRDGFEMAGFAPFVDVRSELVKKCCRRISLKSAVADFGEIGLQFRFREPNAMIAEISDYLATEPSRSGHFPGLDTRAKKTAAGRHAHGS